MIADYNKSVLQDGNTINIEENTNMRSALRIPNRRHNTREGPKKLTWVENVEVKNAILDAKAINNNNLAQNITQNKDEWIQVGAERIAAKSKFKKFEKTVNKKKDNILAKPAAEEEDSAIKVVKRTTKRHFSYPKIKQSLRITPPGRDDLYRNTLDEIDYEENIKSNVDPKIIKNILNPEADSKSLLLFAVAHFIDQEEEKRKRKKLSSKTNTNSIRRSSDRQIRTTIEDKTEIKKYFLKKGNSEEYDGTNTFIHSGLPSIKMAPANEIENINNEEKSYAPTFLQSQRPVTKSHFQKNELRNFNQKKVYEKIDYKLLEILDFLGKGSFGQVYKAFYNPKSKFVALKFYELSEERDMEVLEDAQNEKIIMEKLNELRHPNFVEFYSIYEEEKLNGKRFVVIMMEYGICSMADLLSNGRIYDQEEIFFIIDKLVDGFAAAQEAGISHRDIKPENLILNDNMNDFKIVDFGLGADIEKDEEMEIEFPIGTELYFSPEIRSLYNARGFGYPKRKKTLYNPYKSDVYSLGITILKMMGMIKKDILKFTSDIKDVNGLVRQYPNYQKLIKNVIIKMLQEHPAGRPHFIELRSILKNQVRKRINEKNNIQNLPDKLTNKSDIEKIEYYDYLGLGYDRILAFQKSFSFYEKSLKLQQKVAKEFPDNKSVHFRAWQIKISNSFSKLAYESQKLGNFRQALKFGEDALKIRLEVEENTHSHNIAVCYHSLGSVYQDLGDLKSSLSYYHQSLKIIEDISAKKNLCHEEQFHMASTLNSLGCCQRLLGKPNGALSHHLKALEIFKDLRNTHGYLNIDIQIAKVSLNIGLVYKHLMQYTKSLKWNQESLDLARSNSGEGQPVVANSLNNIGLVYKEMENFETSLDYLLEALKIKRKIFGTNHPQYAAALNNLGSTYYLMKNYEKSSECFTNSLTIFDQALKEDHPLIAKCLFDLGKVNSKWKKHPIAIEYFKKSLTMREKIYKDEVSKDIINTIAWLGDEYSAGGMIEDALSQYEKLIKMLNIRYANKPDHPLMIKTLGSMRACSLKSKTKGKFRDYVIQSAGIKLKINASILSSKMSSFRGPLMIIMILYMILFFFSLIKGEFYILD